MGNPWFDHLKQFRKEHPELSMKQCMKSAKQTYKKAGEPLKVARKTKKVTHSKKARKVKKSRKSRKSKKVTDSKKSRK